MLVLKLYKCVREKSDCKKIILHQMHNILEAGKVMNCTMMALHKMQAENASWQIFFFQHHRSEAHTRRTWQTQKGWWWWDKIIGASIFVEEKLVEAATAAAAAGMTLHAVCCTQSFYPLLWGSKLTQQMAFTMSKHVETALGVLVQVLLLAGWLVGLCQEATKPHRFQSLCIRHRVSVVKWGDQQLLGTFFVLLPTANPDFSLGTRRRAQEAQKGQPCTRPLRAAAAAGWELLELHPPCSLPLHGLNLVSVHSLPPPTICHHPTWLQM